MNIYQKYLSIIYNLYILNYNIFLNPFKVFNLSMNYLSKYFIDQSVKFKKLKFLKFSN